MGSGVNLLVFLPLTLPPPPNLHTPSPNHSASVVKDERRNELLQAAAARTLHAMPRKMRAVRADWMDTRRLARYSVGLFRHTLHGLLSLRLRRRREEVIH